LPDAGRINTDFKSINSVLKVKSENEVCGVGKIRISAYVLIS